MISTGFTRRQALVALGAGALAGPRLPLAADSIGGLPQPAVGAGALDIAKDESYWSQIATFYDRAAGLTNLEHGYWGKMAAPVRDAYLAATTMVNTENSVYGRKQYGTDARESIRRIAAALGAEEGEIALTRNATEAIHNLIRQYNGLIDGDAVLYADIDYPQFKTTMQWLEQRGIRPVRVDLPSRVSQANIFEAYIQAFDAHPNLKLMLITHASNQHGLVLPIADIAKEARDRGIDVICDCAQSWGLVDYKISDLGVDWAGFNLHKWIGSPVGVGALYMRRGTLKKIDPYPGEKDPDNSKVYKRIHMGTSNFAAMISVPTALDFHESIGGDNKEARLRYLRSLWTTEAEAMGHIEVLGGADEASWSGMGSFRLRGKTSLEDAKRLQQRLEHDFGIFTVVRQGLASGCCIRITPQVFTTPDDVAQLVKALKKLGA